MPIELAPEDAASALERAGLPVLCPDTSALLDLARLPRKNEREAAAMDFALRQAGSKFIVLIPVQVWREMDDNLDQVLGQVSTELADARAHLIGLRRAAGIIGITTFEIPDIPLWEFEDGFRVAIRRVMDQAVTASETPTIRERAWSRVHQKLRPAGRGKQNMKDCMVVETVLEVMEAARRLGFQGRATFLSSNTEDFGKTRGGRPHPDLEMSFDAVHLNYAVTFHHARFLLDL